MSVSDGDLGTYLKNARNSIGFTLREVEHKTHGRIKNGYLSQVENSQITRPSPSMLWELAELYGLDYNDLLTRAGHRRSTSNQDTLLADLELEGIPLRALKDLDEDEKADLRQYLEFLKHRRQRAAG